MLLSNKKTYKPLKKADKLAKKPKRQTTQVSIYLHKNELEYLDDMCEKEFIARNAYMRKLLVKDMELNKILKDKGINITEFKETMIRKALDI
ncbi:Uncharacterised protein [Campylobacter hominis]|nr:Uncharacterised protein [Campylobacter hominis]